jgi:hypothetical protein
LVNSCRGLIFLVRAAHNDPEHIIRQRPLQRLRLVPRRAHPHVSFLFESKVTGMAFGIGQTSPTPLDQRAAIRDMAQPELLAKKRPPGGG